MRYVCPELDQRSDSWQDLLVSSTTKSKTLAVDGLNFHRVLTLSKTESGIARNTYFFGASEMLSAVYASRRFDGTLRTIEELADDIGVSITTNFDDSADYAFWVRNLWEMRTNLWYTVFTDDGVSFYLPKRGSKQLKSFTVVGEQHREGICANLFIEGEASGSYPVALDGRNVAPETEDDTQKNRILNKMLSKNNRLTVDSKMDVDVLTWLACDGSDYVILSRRKMTTDSGVTYYRYEAVLEMDESVTFTGADETSFPDARLALNAVSAATASNASALEGHAASYFQTAFNKEEFSALRKAIQSISASTWTKVLFNFEHFDPFSKFNTSSGIYTVENAGLYHLFTHAEIATGTTTGNIVFALAIYKNSSLKQVSWERIYVSSAAAVHTPSLNLIDNATAGDYYEVYVYCSANASVYHNEASNFAGYRIL